MVSYYHRFLAFLLDYLLLFFFVIIAYLLFSNFTFKVIENKLTIVFLALTIFVYNFSYFIFIPFLLKSTIGRKIMKIKYLFTSTKIFSQFKSLLKLELFVNILPFFSLFLFALANYFNFWIIFFQDLYFLFASFAFIFLLSNLFFLNSSSISEKMSHIFFVKIINYTNEREYQEKLRNKKSKFASFSSKITTYE